MRRYSPEYRYRRIGLWFDRRASRLAQARVNREVVSGKAQPFQKYERRA